MTEQISLGEYFSITQKEIDAQTDAAIARIAAATRNHYRALIEAFCEVNGIAIGELVYPSEEDVARALAQRMGVQAKDTPH